MRSRVLQSELDLQISEFVSSKRKIPAHHALDTTMGAFDLSLEEMHGPGGHDLALNPDDFDDLFHKFIDTSSLSLQETEQKQGECEAHDASAPTSYSRAWTPPAESVPAPFDVGDVNTRHRVDDQRDVKFSRPVWRPGFPPFPTIEPYRPCLDETLDSAYYDALGWYDISGEPPRDPNRPVSINGKAPTQARGIVVRRFRTALTICHPIRGHEGLVRVDVFMLWRHYGR